MWACGGGGGGGYGGGGGIRISGISLMELVFYTLTREVISSFLGN